MNDSNARAEDAKRLLADPTWNSVATELKEAAGAVFFNPRSTPEQVTKAHEQVQMIHLFETELKSRVAKGKRQ